MSWSDHIPTVVSGLSALTALAAAIKSWRNGDKIDEVHISLNSRLTELLKQKGLASMAEGLEQGRSENKAADEKPIQKVDVAKISAKNIDKITK